MRAHRAALRRGALNSYELLSEVIQLLTWHVSQGGETVECFFNRQLHERILGKKLKKPSEILLWIKLTPEDVCVHKEARLLSDLMSFPNPRPRRMPKSENAPIVIFRDGGEEYLIDGHTRIKRWREVAAKGPHWVLVVEPRRTP